MSDPKNPMPGDLHIDASDLAVVDLTSNKSRATTKLPDGYGAAIDNVVTASPAMLARAGIDSTEVASLSDSRTVTARAESLRPATKKLDELVTHTIIAHKGKMGGTLNDLATQVKRRAKRDPNGDELLAAFGPLLEYTGAPSKKAVATKVKHGVIKPKTKTVAKAASTSASAPASATSSVTAPKASNGSNGAS